MILYLISGKKHTGKDTAAKYLASKFDKTQIIWFAEPVKLAAKAFLEIVYGCSITDDHMYGSKKEEPLYNSLGQPILGGGKSGLIQTEYQEPVHITFRYMAQWIGTEFGRNVIDQDIWSRAAMIKAGTLKTQGYQSVIIPDCRFKSELKFTSQFCEDKKIDLVTLRMHRPLKEHEEDLHPSEIDLDDVEFDNILENTGTTEELYHQLNTYLSK